MKVKFKYLWILFAVGCIIGCDDETGNMGLEMLPGSDLLEVKSIKYKIGTHSILSDSVFAKVNTGYVGKFTDPEFGFYEASFMAQLNCTEDFKFPDPYNDQTKTGDIAGDTVHRVYFQLDYGKNRYFGDSLNACRMSVYELNAPLKKNYYTSIDPADFYDPTQKPLFRKAYTAVDQSVSDSARRANGYYNSIIYEMPREYGNEILRKNWEHPEYFKNSETFIDNIFKGLYVKSDYGDGTILYIDQVSLVFEFKFHVKDAETGAKLLKKDGTDSIYDKARQRSFSTTKEIIQANKFTNSEKLIEKVEAEEEKDWTYLKSPAGIFTQANLPIQQMYDELKADTLNSVKLTFTGYAPKEDPNDMYTLKPPAYVVLLREKDAYTFFEKNSLPDNKSSYYAQYSTKNEYAFANITNLINYCIAEKETIKKGEGKDWTKEQWDKWEKDTKWNSIVIVPVVINWEQNTQIPSPLSIENDLKPGAIKLKGGEKDSLDLSVEYTVFY
jgi:hypothetical protein